MKPLMICKHHGNLFIDAVIKSGHRDGKQRYKCRMCMKRLHANHYANNKLKIRERHRAYFESNPDKIRDIKNASKRKMYALDPDKYRMKRKLSDKPEKNEPEISYTKKR